MIYAINHSFKESVIVPLVAIANNIIFLCNNYDEDKKVCCADGTLCDVENYEVKSIFDLEDDVMKIYGMDTWSFLKRWHLVDPNMDSLSFVKLKLKKR